MKQLHFTCLVALLTFMSVWGQKKENIVYMDLAHGQRMWNDPKDPVADIGFPDSTRIQFLNEELSKTLQAHKTKVAFLKKAMSYKDLKKGSLLVLHVPSLPYSKKEVKAIKRYIRKGGALLLVMEADYWTDIKKTNVNDILKPFDIAYGKQSKDTLAGGYTKKGHLHAKRLKVTYQLGRVVKGGTPFCFNSQDHQPFGVYKKVKNGGKLVVLGDAMSSLYMTVWKDVSDYQCHEFMDGIYRWLLN